MLSESKERGQSSEFRIRNERMLQAVRPVTMHYAARTD